MCRVRTYDEGRTRAAAGQPRAPDALAKFERGGRWPPFLLHIKTTTKRRFWFSCLPQVPTQRRPLGVRLRSVCYNVSNRT